MRYLSILSCAALVCGIVVVAPAMARDVATEQYNVSAARKQYNEAQSEYDALGQQIEAQTQRVAQEQARLDDLKKQQQAAKAGMDKSKARLKQQEQALEKAWGSSN